MILFVFVFSALLLGHDQVALSEKEPDLIDDSFPRDNKKLTGSAESIHNPVTSERQNHIGWFPVYFICSCIFQLAYSDTCWVIFLTMD